MKRIAIAAACWLAAPAAAGPAENARVFDRVWSLTAERYWDRGLHGVDWDAARARFRPQAVAAPDSRRLYAVLEAMLDLVHDSHLVATSPERLAFERARLRRDGEASGFGFDAEQAGGRWQVATVQPDGPAAAAGVQIGWTLEAVDGRPPDIDRHFGAGDRATIDFTDEFGRPQRRILVGTPLAAEPDRGVRALPGGVRLIRFDGFYGDVAGWLRAALAEGPPPAAVILDLRRNGGGANDVLDRVAGLFLPARTPILRLVGRRTETERTRGSQVYDGPLAVLVGPDTVSAAEALAAAVVESGRGIAVGRRSAGALTAGVDHRLPDGGRLTVAEQDIRTAAGTRIEGAGVAPTHDIAASLADRRAGRDTVAEAAARLLLRGRDAPPPAR